MQQTISLWTMLQIGMTICSGLYLLSVLWPSAPLPGNFAMLLRNAQISGFLLFTGKNGLLFAAGLLFVSYAAGAFKMKREEFPGKEEMIG